MEGADGNGVLMHKCHGEVVPRACVQQELGECVQRFGQKQLGDESVWKELGECLQKNLEGVWGEFGEDLLERLGECVQGGIGGVVKRECGRHSGKLHAVKVEGKEGREGGLSEQPKLERWVMEDTSEQSQAVLTGAQSLCEDSRGRGKRDQPSSLVEEDTALEHCVKCSIPLLQAENCG